jgi:opacity protein-like surface antigen
VDAVCEKEEDMTSKKTLRTICLAGLMLALLAGATAANAQSREGRWEFTLGIPYQLGSTTTYEGGTTVKTNDDFGFGMTFGYNSSERVTWSLGLKWAGIGYDGEFADDQGVFTGVSGTYDAWGLSGNLLFNLGQGGPLTPFVGAGIGYSWIDTNIPNGAPSTGCFWDPWYGYICYTDYPTKTVDAFSYQAMLGLRYAFNPRTFLRVSYISQWMDQPKGTPRFDLIGLEVGWLF